MKTPLHEIHRQLGARMAPFAGWDMPIQYTGIVAEHLATRTACGVFDICHMGEFELSGPTAAADLDRLITSRIGALAVGQCRYGYLLNDAGGVLDDLTCYRLGPDRFMLVVNAGTRPGDWAWVSGHLSSTTTARDRSDELAKLDVQGPVAHTVMTKAFGVPPPALGYFRFCEIALDGAPCLLSRTGYTGEFGYELYFPAARAADFWNRLTAAGATPVGLGARDTLRLEMGYPLYGHELGTGRTPVAAARGLFMDVKKDFIGRAACVRDLEHGAAQYLVGLRLASRQAARAGDAVRAGGNTIGQVTSGSLAPSLNVAVALAYVDAPFTAPGTAVELDVRGRPLPAEVVELPFYREGTARKTPVA